MTYSGTRRASGRRFKRSFFFAKEKSSIKRKQNEKASESPVGPTFYFIKKIFK